MISAQTLIRDLEELKNPAKGKILSGFFKTGKGQYGEGDIFWGINVPDQRIVAKKYSDISLEEVQTVLEGKVHEQRLTALLILVNKFRSGDLDVKSSIYKLYLSKTKYINNWDLVDLSAPNIIGSFLLKRDKKILSKLAGSGNLWERRISIVATLALIRENNFEETLKIAEILLHDPHDLIHKAVGWMLREVGKRDGKSEEQFLNKHYRRMPRTMLRYAIEKFGKEKKEFYMRV